MPRFRALAAHEISEKSPGEVVTCADRESEARLHDGLMALGLDARIVGEEACAEDPSLLDGIGKGLIWLVDPLDGTANFAAGRAPFGLMVALIDNGDPVASWMLDPVSGRLCHAARGLGAWIDGEPVYAHATTPAPVAALATQFMTPADRALVHERAERQFRLEAIPRCAAESYPRLVLGRNHASIFQRILPWDHAAGVLFLTEAGGRATHWNGEPYRVGSDAAGLLVASSDAMWKRAAGVLAPALQSIGGPKALAA